jgi:type I restriction enzyme S subunit
MEVIIEKTTALQTYSTYKDSGVEWLGEIPEHWEVKKLKYIFEILKRISGELGYEVLSITQTGIKIKDVNSGEGQLSMDYSKYQLVFEGDFAMNHMDLLTGYVDVSKYNGVISPDYRVFNILNSKYNKDYLLLLLQLCYKNKVFYAHGQGVSMLGRWRFPADNFNNFSFPVPTLSEQTAIANFIDDKTTKIDQAIAIKQKQIQLLKERRQILIHKVVTRGLNDKVKLKDSGVEWIGEIPEHWEVKKIKYLSRVKRGASPRPIDDPRYFNDNGIFAWVRIADVSQNNHYLINTVQTLSKLGASLSVKIYPNELFISIAGTVGKPMISKIKCCIHDGFVYFPDLKINAEFIYRIFETGQPYLGLGKHGTQLNLNTETIGSILVPLPPLKEIEKIIEKTDEIDTKFDTAISLKEQEIEKLKEYKMSLIDGVVTGKVKVC